MVPNMPRLEIKNKDFLEDSHSRNISRGIATAGDTHMGRRSQIASTPKDYLGFSNLSEHVDFHPMISQRISVGSSRMSKLACH